MKFCSVKWYLNDDHVTDDIDTKYKHVQFVLLLNIEIEKKMAMKLWTVWMNENDMNKNEMKRQNKAKQKLENNL